ncbi:Activating signal cointegrator 1 [Brachionus plicatilis]|uniref:Activating signal cointegrator 1 n=1 Tax=Brachionus plicatilis TaxID=10195 RepID=A0A3M7PQV8_BRAPC|nr:Activating signal cointegrator 1 [Brachionus plicatilis]
MEALPMVKWLHKELSVLLECDISEEYAKNILNIETQNEIHEFIGSLLDLSIDRNKRFLKELLEKIQKPAHHPDITVYQKPELGEPKSKFDRKSQKTEAENISPITQLKQHKKKEFKLTNDHALQSKNLNRKLCDCQASKHKLIGNCLKCGRIVCEQEGSGPCYFCGNLVCTREEMEKINRGSNKGQKLKQDLLSRNWNAFEQIEQSLAGEMNQQDEENLLKAIDHKNKLIDYDRTSAKRTQVIDDESDYFNTNSKWLSQQQKTLLEKKEKEFRDKRFANKFSNQKFSIDFAGRKIVDEKESLNLDDVSCEIDHIMKSSSERPVHGEQAGAIVNRDMDSIKLKFLEERTKKKSKKETNEGELENKKSPNYRIQNPELQEMKDEGMCLSMHQPWASLLINGIKKHEGRSWYTPLRGRLWIHAASKQPSETDIKEMETFYKCYYSNHQLEFPSSYPTSCLLGYIDLVDCLSTEAYREEFPNGESESEFVFICKNPNELLAKIPMSGNHKIFKLDKSIHSIAKKTSMISHDF